MATTTPAITSFLWATTRAELPHTTSPDSSDAPSTTNPDVSAAPTLTTSPDIIDNSASPSTTTRIRPVSSFPATASNVGTRLQTSQHNSDSAPTATTTADISPAITTSPDIVASTTNAPSTVIHPVTSPPFSTSKLETTSPETSAAPELPTTTT
ncbi:hypothetical protein BVRB_040780, partial [Beta vulgaris subsp. vulgaris]